MRHGGLGGVLQRGPQIPEAARQHGDQQHINGDARVEAGEGRPEARRVWPAKGL